MSNTPIDTPKMTDVQQILMATLRDLCDRKNPMDVERARAVGQVASVMVDTVKVSIDYLKVTGQDHTTIAFLDQTTVPEAVQLGHEPNQPHTLFANGVHPLKTGKRI